MPNRIKNQAIKLYTYLETLFNEKTSRCEWHEDYFPLVGCNDVSEIVINMTEAESNVGVDSEFNFVVTGLIDVLFFGNTEVTDFSATFITDGVVAGMYFMGYVTDADSLTGGGIKILSVNSETNITLIGTLPVGIVGSYYEISKWDYIGDVRTVNGYAEIDNASPTSVQSAIKQTIEDETLYKVEFTITFIDPDAPTSFLDVSLGSNSILNLFVDDIEAKKYTVFGKSDGTLFQLFVDGNPRINIDNVVLSIMEETTFEIKNCVDDNVEYSSEIADFVYSNTLNQLKMLIDWSNVDCNGCYYINVVQGSERISNGSFDSSLDWILGTNWTISGGKAIVSGIASDSLSQELLSDLTVGKDFTIAFDIEDYVSGDITLKLLSSSSVVYDLGTFNSNGTHTAIVNNLSEDIDEISFVPSLIDSATLKIDNVSIVTSNYRTDCMNVSDSLDCTVKLSGTNNDNAFGIDFESLFYSPTIRVKGELMTPTYDGDKENEEDSLGISKTLYFKSEEKRNLYIYEVPNYYHSFIRLLLGYDVLQVDDVSYISSSAGYTPENERVLGKLPDLSSSTTEVRLRNDLNENKFC